MRVPEAIRRHAVALISLAVALSGLAYNTWRNETTEAHRNTRQAAFVLLEQLGELQQVADLRYYAGKRSDTIRISGWGNAAMIRDMGMLVSAEASRQSAQLFGIWQRDVDGLDAGEPGAEQRVASAIVSVREQVLRDLEALR